MTTQNNTSRRSTMKGEFGRYVPRRFNALTRERFLRDRRRRYLAQVPSSQPTDAQSALIQSLATLEWSALVSEAAGGVQALAAAREHRRLLMRFLQDFTKSVQAPQKPADPMEALRRHLAGHKTGAAA